MSLMRKIRMFQFTTTGIRTCGMLFLLAGVVGAMIQTNLLGVGNMTNTQLLDLLEQNPSAMADATLSLALQALGSCALPIFCFLLVEGATHTARYSKYMLRVLGMAVVCQLPYNMLMTGNIWYMSKLNPVFALLLCQIMLYFFRTYREKKAGHVLLKAIAILGVYLWSNMLGVEHGACCVLLTAVLWALRGKTNLQTLVGIFVMFGCTIFSMYYIAGPVAFLILHFYEGQKGNENRLVNYLAYPVMLLAGGLLTVLL